jgi:hypothetical protein
MRGPTAERKTTTMKNAEATNTTETAAVAEQGAPVAPAKAPSKKGASQKKGAPKGRKVAKGAKTKAAPPKKEAKAAPKKQAKAAPKKEAKASKKAPKPAAEARPDSKKSLVIELLRRKNGATLAEIMEQMGWQKHTVRGFMAGAMKKAGYTVESFKSDKGERTYRINQ